MQSFDVLSLDTSIQKSYLLEASAGTGKTFAIEHLVARLLIEEPLISLSEILVVTFTKASALDLKIRIRNTLDKLLTACKGGQSPSYLVFRDDAHKKQLQLRVEEALFYFEEADIFTIHGFCAAMLRETGLQEGNKQGEEAALEVALDVVRDCFRVGFNHLDFGSVQIKKALGASQKDLGILEKKIARLALKKGRFCKLRNYATLLEIFLVKLEHLKNQFPSKEALFSDFFSLAPFYKQIQDRKKEVKPEVEQKIVRFLEGFYEGGSSFFDQLIEEGIVWCQLFSEENQLKNKGSINALKLHFPTFTKQLFQEIKPLVDEAASFEAFLLRVALLCQGPLQKALEEKRIFQFDDLLFLLLDKLKNLDFLETLQQRYRALIIDEFQDTDPVQWEIFKTLYDPSKNRMYLVGDPKQSIYAFRQADIYTYLEAASFLGEENRATLDTNFRSQEGLITALNHLFLTVNEGHWLALPKIKSTLSYRPVKAGKKGIGKDFQDELSSFNWMIADLVAHKKERGSFEEKEVEELFFFPYLVEEVKRLVNHCGFSYGDIACLVADRYQAERLALALKKGGVPFLRQRQGTLKDSIALLAIFELFQALFSLKEESLIKIVLGGMLLAWNEEALKEFHAHPFHRQVMEQFYLLKAIFDKEGIAACLSVFFEMCWNVNEESLGAELLKRGQLPIVEDFYQLIHYLSKFPCDESLLEVLQEMLEGRFDEDPDFQRKEAGGKEALSILTLHASKGLEFCVVFALGLIQRGKKPEKMLIEPSKEGCFFSPVWDEDSLDYLNFCKELEAEKLRQLYVALTRAKDRLYVPWIHQIKKNHATSPIQLFLGEEGTEIIEQLTKLDEISKVILSPQKLHEEVFQQENTLNFSPKGSFDRFFNPVLFHSFSSLTSSLFLSSELDLNSKKEKPQSLSHCSLISAQPLLKTPHHLPKGPFVGTFFHELLEDICFSDVRLNQDQLLKRIAEKTAHTELFGWEEVIFQMLEKALTCKLPAGFSLDLVPLEEQHREIEFLYPNSFNDQDLGVFRQIKEEGAVSFFKGVIDLFFTYQNRFYIVDWKTNWLGEQESFYEKQSLKQAMLDHHYFLQEKLYREAVKKYLNLFEKESFEKKFGGTFYLFLRGIDASGRGIFWIP